MKRIAFSGVGVIALMTSACVYIDAEDDGRFHMSAHLGLEELRAVNISDQSVSIRIASNGCTNKDTVSVDVDRDGRNEYELAFDRKTEDRCRAFFPNGVELSWTFEELGIPERAYVRVLNNVGAR